MDAKRHFSAQNTMNQTAINNLVNKINAALKQVFPDIKNIKIDDEKDKCSIFFGLNDDTQFSWELMKENEFIKIRCDVKTEGQSYEELLELSAELQEKMERDVMPMVMDDLVVLQYLYSYKNEEDGEDIDKTVRSIFNETMSFVSPIYSNIDILHGKPVDTPDNELSVELGEFNSGGMLFNYDDIDVYEDVFANDYIEDDFDDEEEEDQDETELTSNNEGEIEEEVIEEEIEVTSAEDSINEEEKIDEEEQVEDIETKQDNFKNMIDALVKDIDADIYDPNGYINTPVESDEINALLENDELDSQFVRTKEDIRVLEEQINTATNSLKTTITKMGDLSLSLFSRDKEITAKEQAFVQRESLFKQECNKFNNEYNTFLEEKKIVDEKKATIQDIKDRDQEIANLKASIEADKDNEARQSYLLDLRKKNIYQEEYIAKISTKLAEYKDLVLSLKDSIEDSGGNDEEAGKELDVLRSEIAEKEAVWEAEKTERDDKIKELNRRVKKLKEEKGSSITDNTEIVALKEELEMVSKDLDEATRRADEEREEKESIQERFDVLKEQNDKTKEELELTKERSATGDVDVDYDNVAKSIIDQAEEAGIEFSPIPSANGIILGGMVQDCEVSYDVENMVIFVQKTFKKTKKIQNDIAQLNNKDIRTSYILFDNGTLQCKAFCVNTKNVTRTLLDIVNEINSYA